MKLIIKAQAGVRVPEAQSDNTQVVLRPQVPRDYKPKVQRINTTPILTEDKRPPQQREVDYRVGKYLNNQEQIKQNTAKGLAGIGTFISPSTYIGPLFRNNGKDYSTNMMSGEGTGNAVGNLATDVAAFGLPGLIRKGLTIPSQITGAPKIFTKHGADTKYSDISALKFLQKLQKQSLEIPDKSKLPADPKVLDTDVMAPEVRQYFTKQSPYVESFHSGRDHATVIGEYQNPQTQLYYDNIVKPLLKDHNDLQIKPMKVLEFKEQPKWAGLHRLNTHESFVGQNIPEAKSIQIHEAVGHGTEQYVNPKDYRFLFFNEDNHPFAYDTFLPSELDFQVKQKAMVPWYEQRATFEEARGELYEKACSQLGKTLNLKEFSDYIDNLSDLDIFKSMYVNSKNQLRNGYAGRMAMPFNGPRNIFLEKTAPPKDLVSKYRTQYKTLPTIGIPTIIGGKYLKQKKENLK